MDYGCVMNKKNNCGYYFEYIIYWNKFKYNMLYYIIIFFFLRLKNSFWFCEIILIGDDIWSWFIFNSFI